MNKFLLCLLITIIVALMFATNPSKLLAQNEGCQLVQCLCDGTCDTLPLCEVDPNNSACNDGAVNCVIGPVDCPAGYTRGTTVLTNSCRNGKQSGCRGTAQALNGTCNCRWDDENVWSCMYNVSTYNCIAPCDATSPPLSSINYSSNALTWAAGSNGTSQNLYVSTVPNDVENDCGAGTNCDVNTTGLSASTTSYSFSPALTAGTTYYVKIVTYKDSSCSPSTLSGFTTPLPNIAWWQVKDGDVTTNGNLSSDVPSGQLFNVIGSGGFPGIPVYGAQFSLSADTPKISVNKWNANTITTSTRLFNYSYFENLIPADVISAQAYPYTLDGYKWTMITGDYTMPATDFGATKNILFVNGNLTINGNINLTDNLGFFGTFVNGTITVNPSITGTPAIEGIYLSNGAFSTGTTGLGDSQLHIRGSVASFGNINLQRDLSANASPAEIFEFAPDQIMLYPEKLGFRGQKWVEVAP